MIDGFLELIISIIITILCTVLFLILNSVHIFMLRTDIGGPRYERALREVSLYNARLISGCDLWHSRGKDVCENVAVTRGLQVKV